jgi:beta-glucosidase
MPDPVAPNTSIPGLTLPDFAPVAPPAGAGSPAPDTGPVPDPAALPRFPAGFTWGTATAAYQIEGAVGEDGRGTSVWDTFSHTPGRTHEGDTGDVACDHYHRYAEDVALMADLGTDAYRFSVAWPRIQPEGTGPANQRGLDFYRRLLDELDGKGIRAFLTLYHWDLPQALEDKGGWLVRDTALRFAEYAAIVGEALRDRVAWWAPINEAFVHWSEGYAIGAMAPGRAMLFEALPAAHHLLLGHGLAAGALRSAGVTGAIGSVNNLTVVRPASPDPADLVAAGTFDMIRNRLFLEPLLTGAYPGELLAAFPQAAGLVSDPADLATIAAPLDFLGVNHYNPEVLRAEPASPLGFDWVPPTGETTGFGWAVDAGAFRETLVGLRDRHGAALPPVYITENGASYPDVPGADGRVDDRARIRYLDGYLRAVRAAMDDGVDVRGYFAWSLLDNFEWAVGYSQRFGLVHVDFETQRRTKKASFAWYRDAIAASGR